MEITIQPDDISYILYMLEKEYTSNPTEKLRLMIDRLYKSQGAPSREQRIFFPTNIPEIDLFLLSLLPDRELLSTCRANRYTAELCRDERFWRDRIAEHFGASIEGYLNEGETYKEAYLDLKKAGVENKGILKVTVFQKGYIPILEKLVNFKSTKVVKQLLIDAVEEILPVTFKRIIQKKKKSKILKDKEFITSLIRTIIENTEYFPDEMIDIVNIILDINQESSDILLKLSRGEDENTMKILFALPINYKPSYKGIISAITSTLDYKDKNLKNRMLDHLIPISHNIPDFLENIIKNKEPDYLVQLIMRNSLDINKDTAVILDLILLAIKVGNKSNLSVLAHNYYSLLSEDILLAAHEKDIKIFDIIMKELPRNFKFSREFLNKLDTIAVKIVAGYFRLSSMPNKNILIDKIMETQDSILKNSNEESSGDEYSSSEEETGSEESSSLSED